MAKKNKEENVSSENVEIENSVEPTTENTSAETEKTDELDGATIIKDAETVLPVEGLSANEPELPAQEEVLDVKADKTLGGPVAPEQNMGDSDTSNNLTLGDKAPETELPAETENVDSLESSEEKEEESEFEEVEVYNPMMCRHEKRWTKKQK